jgi:apolipoprotein N-acyltransferase
VATAAGLLVFASLPPRGWWWAGVVGFGLLAAALRDLGWRARTAIGFVAGVAWFAPGLAWVAGFSLPGAVLLVVLQAALVALTAALVWRGRVVLLPLTLVVGEWLRTSWPFGGFPLAAPALGQVDAPFAAAASLAGPIGVTVLAAASGLAGAEFVAGRRRRAAALVTGVAVATVTGMAVTTTAPVGPAVHVAVVQGGGPRGIPAVVADAADEVLDRHLQVSDSIPAGTDLVVWPEGVVDVAGPVDRVPEAELLAALARRTGATLIAGVVEDVPANRFRNAAVVWDPSGRMVDRYDKVHRVPFGEYVPARALLARLVDLSLVPRDAIPGRGPGILSTPVGPVGATISFEVFFSDRARAAVAAGGRLLVVPTNAASFVTDDVPSQELAAARLRAIETGRAVIQAAPTGYSAIIGPDGTVHARSGLGDPHLLTGQVIRRRGRTPYTVLGDLPLLLAAAAALGLAARRRSTDSQ